MSLHWDRFRASTVRLGGNGSASSRANSFGDGGLRHTSSQTVRLGRVQPQHPGHRTIFSNDREANMPVRFKVLSDPFS